MAKAPAALQIGNTTFRRPWRIPEGLRSLKKFNEEYNFKKNRKSEDYEAALINSISDTGVLESKGKVKGWKGGHGRKFLNLCQKFGFITPRPKVISGKGTYNLNENGEDKFILNFLNNTSSKIKLEKFPFSLTPLGNMLAETKSDEFEITSEQKDIFLRSLYYQQQPSILHSLGNDHKGETIRPLQLFLKIFFQLEKLGLENSLSTGEISLVINTAWTNNVDKIVKDIKIFRKAKKGKERKFAKQWFKEKGGEKIFRIFISKLNGEGDYKKPVNVNRDFYEELIAKIILFRSMEKIYGSGKKAMGQLRSAAIPYSLSVLYMITDGHKTKPSFDFLKIWLNERLESDLESYLESLLKLMNELIKQYSESDDYAEYSKKEELWNKISKSNEIQNFIVSDLTKQIIRKYGISKADLKKRKGESNSLKEVDFKNVLDSISIHSKGKYFYDLVKNSLQSHHGNEEHMIGRLIKAIDKRAEIPEDLLAFEKELINRVKFESPALLDKVASEENQLQGTLDYIISRYNSCVNEKGDIITEFNIIEAQAKKRGVSNSNAHIFSKIGQQFLKGNSPSVEQIYQASIYYKSKPGVKKKLESLVN